MFFKASTFLAVTVAMATIEGSISQKREEKEGGSVFRMKRSPRKGLPSFSLTSTAPTTEPVTTATTCEPGPSEREIAEKKIKEFLNIVDEVLNPEALKAEENKLIMARAVESYLQNTLSGIEDDGWIVHKLKFTAIKIRLCTRVTNTTNIEIAFHRHGDQATNAMSSSTEGSKVIENTTVPSGDDTDSLIRVPEDVLDELFGKRVVFAAVYYFHEVFAENNDSKISIEDNSERTVRNSGVLSCFYLVNGVLTSLPVEMSFKHGQTFNPIVDEAHRVETTRLITNSQTITEAQTLCSYYDYDIRGWSQTGCQADRTASSNMQTSCRCNHTTNFVVLMQIKEFTISETHIKALDIITTVGCSISLIALIATLIAFVWLEALKSDHNIIHCNLIIALLMAQGVFLSGVSATNHRVACMAVAILLHISFLSVFTWMLMEGVHLYSKVVIVFGTESSKTKYYVFTGWGVPIIIVTIAAAVNPNGYGTPTGCWLDMKSGQIWAFVGPAVMVLMINIVILVVVLRIVVASTRTSSEHRKESSYIRTATKSSLFLLPILGITWLFGLLAVEDNSLVFQYMFAVSNSLQGLFIFMFQGSLTQRYVQRLEGRWKNEPWKKEKLSLHQGQRYRERPRTELASPRRNTHQPIRKVQCQTKTLLSKSCLSSIQQNSQSWLRTNRVVHNTFFPADRPLQWTLKLSLSCQERRTISRVYTRPSVAD
ncbi:adhesion G-protein coupled receptor D1-like [Ptychodera flava]|uniref:adhesion G-protein coupled receptor D1-like n=1 Tax=Ptychodera flava TaxID=63121 RepID=UPI003969D131